MKIERCTRTREGIPLREIRPGSVVRLLKGDTPYLVTNDVDKFHRLHQEEIRIVNLESGNIAKYHPNKEMVILNMKCVEMSNEGGCYCG